MAIPGTKPIPNEIKKLNGTYRADRHGQAGLVALPQPEGTPEPPRGLGQIGLDAWDRVFTKAPWVHHQADYEIVRMLCESLDERELLKAHLEGDPENWRVRAGLRELEKQITSIMSTLGLNPSDRARYGFALVKTESKLEALLRKKREDEEDRGLYRDR